MVENVERIINGHLEKFLTRRNGCGKMMLIEVPFYRGEGVLTSS